MTGSPISGPKVLVSKVLVPLLHHFDVESGYEMRGMMGMQGLRVGMMGMLGTRVGMMGIRAGMRGTGCGNEENKGENHCI